MCESSTFRVLQCIRFGLYTVVRVQHREKERRRAAEMEDEEEDERREAAIATRASLQPNFKPDGVSQSQLSKFQELHRRRLQIKAKSKIKKKAKGEILVGISGENSKSRVKNLDANDVTEEISSKEIDHSSVSILKGNTTKDIFSQQQENVAVHIGTKKRQKLHWGLDTKERWERKANM
ncbi:unnamed protein product [Camellia sinensis]